MVKQVGPALGQPKTIVAFEAVASIGFPERGFRHGPGVLGDPSNEAGDTFAVRPVSLTPLPAASRATAHTPHLGGKETA